MFLPRSAVLLCVFISSALAPACVGQLPPVSNTTSTPIPGAGHDYLGGPAETVNPANGSVSIRVPVILPPGRGITLPFSFAYDSNGVNYVGLSPTQGYGEAMWLTPSETPYSNPWTQGGWSDSIPIASRSLLSWQTLVDGGPTKINCYALINFLFQDPRGNRHNLNLTSYSDPGGTGQCTINSNNWPKGFEDQIVTQGGEGSISASISSGWDPGAVPYVVDGDGVEYGFSHGGTGSGIASAVVDRNGNTITINSNYPSFSYIDTAGRTVLQDSGFATNPETLTVSGLSAPYTLTWTALAEPTFATPVTTISGTCPSPVHTWGTTVAVSAITLPNGKSFSYTYDPVYGLVNRMTYPSGGYVRFVWGMDSQAEYGHATDQYGNDTCEMYYGVPVVTDRYVSFDGSHEVLHQNFVYSNTWTTPNGIYWANKQTTVTTYDLVRNTNFRTVYSYSPIYDNWQPNAATGAQPQIPVESTIAYYDTTGALLKTVSKGWKNERMLASQETSFPNGQASLTVFCYNSSELETEHDDYDFGTSAPTLPACAAGAPAGAASGPTLRKTLTTYATNTNMALNHVIDKPASVVVTDGNNNRVAETDYTYDTPVGTTTSGIAQHPSTCNCGNLTEQSQWLNTSSTTINTTYTNDDTGQRLSMTDPRGNQTTYSYTDNYSSGSPTSPTNAYLTTATYPQTSGVSHIQKYAYAYASGEVTSSTDQNNLVTYYKYVDSLARLTETDLPDGGVTSNAYNDSAYSPSTPSPSVTTTKTINTTASEVSIKAFDGLGHPVRSELSSDPQGTVYSDTSYDGLARVYTVSNPYRSGTDPTTSPGTTTYVYDALGRKLTETEPDGSVLTTAYCAGSTLVTDPTGRWRRSRVDGLGRLVEVDEPNAVGVTVASTGCPGTGEPIWVTTYGYDTLGNMTSVLQNGSHARSFIYDSLSRLLCSSNPENSYAPCPTVATSTYTTGTTGYTYDADGNVASKTTSTSHLPGTSGSGSAMVNGTEQSILGAPAVSGTGSVTFSGTLQSKQVVSQPATHGTGSATITGQEASGTFCNDIGTQCHLKYNSGSVTITINAIGYSISYGQSSTSSAIAASLGSLINAGTVATATVSGSTLSLTSVATGTGANYSLTSSSTTNDPTDFGSPSFFAQLSGSTLTGGQNTVYTTLYDSGTSTITVNGHADTVNWTGSGTTSSSIATALASAINADSSAYVTASASSATVNLTAKITGASTDYSLSSSYTYDSTDFSSSSFTSSNSGAALTGGRNAGTTVYDSGSVWIILNGTQYSASYGQVSSSASLASTLASAINSGSLATASVSGSGITITASAIGAVTNYSLSSGSSTSQPGSFSSPSFSVSVSGASLSGGTNPGSQIVTSYAYDTLNRLLSRSYSNGDPTVSITYDQSSCLSLMVCQNIGKRTSVTDAAGSEAWSYQVDATNHRSVHADQRTTTSGSNNITKTAAYYLDLAGNVTQAVYPTGRVVNYTYNAADRPITATDGSNGIAYATDFQTTPTGCLSSAVCYTPQGSFYALSIGQSSSFTGFNLSHTYNTRLQPNEFKASSSAGNAVDITYSYADPLNNNKNAGHVFSITNNLNSSRTQTFTYDQVNRITSAGTIATTGAYCWGYQYAYDAWANLQYQQGWSPNYTGCSEMTMSSAIADGNNHLPGFTYDSTGNTLSDGTISYTYDAESQIKAAAGVTYTYDGDGRRVYKSSGKLYWYGAGGDILAETDGSGNTLNEYVFFGGKRIAMLPAGGNPIYYVEDMLGSSRVIVQSTGTLCYDADFDPYGGEHAYTNTCSQNYKFEGKERDTETGNDDFGARYYSSRFGRWLSADWSNVPVPVPYANLTNPQTLNLYSMVSDDPESFADLDGHIQIASQGLGAEAGGINGGTGELLPDGLSCESHPESCESAAEEQDQQKQIQKQYQQQTHSIAQTAQNIADHHATAYLKAKSKDKYKAGSNKCNQLVADTIQDSGRQRPQVPRSGLLGLLGLKRDPTAHEWADPNIQIPGWSGPKPVADAQPGDVIAQGHGDYGHAGIVVGTGLTISVNSTTSPEGMVTKNNWGFRPTGQNGEGPGDQAPVVRSYTGSNQ
jgi:RHS repeat-associated protein